MFRGKIEKLRDGHLLGWLLDDARTGAAIEFDLQVNGQTVGRFVADQYRRDLETKGHGTGRHGFRVRVVREWVQPGVNRFEIACEGVAPLPPLVIELSEDDRDALRPPAAEDDVPGALLGRIERVAAERIEGWLRNPERDEPVTFALHVNGHEAARYRADRSRPDLRERGVGGGLHGFEVPLPRKALGVGENVLTLVAQPERWTLPEALVVVRAEGEDAEELFRIERLEHVRARQALPDGPDAPGSEEEQRRLLQRLRKWPPASLGRFRALLDREALLPIARQLFKQEQWAALEAFAPPVGARRAMAEIGQLAGRGMLRSGRNDAAAEVLARAAEMPGAQAATAYYASVAFARAGKMVEAVDYGRRAVAADPERKQYLVDLGNAVRRKAAYVYQDPGSRHALLRESIDLYERALAIDDDRRAVLLTHISRAHMTFEDYGTAVATLDRLLEAEPDHVDALLLKSQALIGLNRIKDALTIAERVLELDPLRQGPRFQLRALQALVDESAGTVERFALATFDDAARRLVIASLPGEEDGGEVTLPYGDTAATGVAALPYQWLVFADAGVPPPSPDTLRKLRTGAKPWAGRVVAEEDGGEIAMWRRDLLINFGQCDAIATVATLRADLDDFTGIVATMQAGRPPAARIDMARFTRPLASGRAVLMSRYGIVRFGGGEHFLASMAQYYAAHGLEPLMVGTTRERIGDEGEVDGVRFAFVAQSAIELRRLLLRERPRVVHTLSGLGFELAEALEFLDIPFVYGVHYWRDCLGLTADDSRYFLAHDREPIAKPAFRYVVEQAATIYGNSEYTREIMEDAFAVRPPVIFSLPDDVEAPFEADADEIDAVLRGARDYVLLVNSRTEKGFGLLLDVARRLPDLPFVAIATQSNREEAEALVRAAGVPNMRILDFTDRMDIVYAHARVVAVASYAFVETFSRAVIEAHRYGKPVLGSTTGNVPYLLRQSGVILPEDADAWADEIRRIYSDDAHHAALQDKAHENSERYRQRRQRTALDGIVSTLAAPILIGVGSGIGNLLHVAPMIRNISRRLGRKVDVVMTEDHKEGLFLLGNDDYVNSVYAVRQEVLRRHYDLVYITHSFGSARLPFAGREVMYARDWQMFEPGGPLHEAVHNLAGAEAQLGIPYDEADTRGYFVGNYRYVPPPIAGGLRIGMHGGSKEGFWTSKRWPGHAELAQRLQARGHRVFSLGIPEEYVPGTEDRTGGTIAQMVERMLDLHYVVSNDSGVMNLANALGIPVLGLFGPTNPATRGPITAHGRSLAIATDCSPCEITRTGRETFNAGLCRCIALLDVDTVEDAVLAHLEDARLVA